MYNCVQHIFTLCSMFIHKISAYILSTRLKSNYIPSLSIFYYRFRIDNTDHVIDVNQGRKNTITEFDQVNILCPFYDKKTTPNINETERFVIYHVQKQEYDMCNLLSGNPKAIVICDKPYSQRHYTLSFRSFSPTPNAMEFQAGKDYYFMSTSSKQDLRSRSGGMCRSHNMKLVFKVADINSAMTRVPPKSRSKVNKNHHRTSNDNHVNNNNNHATSSSPSQILDHQSDKHNKRPKNSKNSRMHTNLTPQEVSYGNFGNNNGGNSWRSSQKEPKSYQPGYVEKVNNYIKNSPSIGGYGGINASSGRIVTNYRLFFILVLMMAVVCF